MQLQKYKPKDPKKIGIGIFTVVCILLVAGVFLYTSFASFETNKTFNIINGKAQDLGDVYFAFYVDNELVSEMPLQNTGYILDEENSTCTNNATVTWNYSEWFPEVRNLTKTRTKCTLYFKKTKKVQTVLGEIEVYEYTPDFTKSACDDETCESHEKGIFETTDANGTTYYYRGSVENNYVYFANRYWRIIRINGDGTIRIIYDGTSAHDNGESSTDRQVGTSPFNPTYNDNMYVGYMYTEGEVHGTGTSSTIKQANDAFYTTVLASYSNYIDTNAGFCGDRGILNDKENIGVGIISTYYKAYLRVTIGSPTLLCENESDLYSLKNANQGNKALTYPIGLITADEVIFSGSGGVNFDGYLINPPQNVNGYLTTGNPFYTMTPVGSFQPIGVDTWSANVFFVTLLGSIDDRFSLSNYIYGLRPVINLKSDVTITGDGTKMNPYRVS